MTPEFSHIIAVDTIGAGGRDVELEAGPDARRRVAARFGWVSVDALTATVHLSVRAGGIDARGHVSAALVQRCVATGDPVPETVDTGFAVRFVETGLQSAGGEEVELGDDDLDIIDYAGANIDVGEAVTQTLALSVDPWPRAPDADDRLRAAGVRREGEQGGALAGLGALLKR